MKFSPLFAFPKPRWVSNGALGAAITKPVYRFVLDEHGGSLVFTLNALPPSSASVSITRIDIGPNFAPLAMTLRATGMTGFAVEEPPADPIHVHDPTQSHITFVWTVDDDPYTPISPINIPDVWKGQNLHYGSQITHTFNTGGKAYTWTLFAFDEAGNWATATYTTPTIQTREAARTDTACIYYSAAGDFSEVPAGVPAENRVTTWTAAIDRANVLDNGPFNLMPWILLRRGETYANHGQVLLSNSLDNGVRVSTYGSSPNRPIVQFDPTLTGFCFVSGPDLGRGPLFDKEDGAVLEDIIFQGNWDQTTETGVVQSWNDITYTKGLLYHRCEFSGFNTFDMAGQMHDCHVTNGKIFTLTHPFFAGRISIVNCALHTHVDALSGGGNGTNDPDNFQFGNMHHVRFLGCSQAYICRTSSFCNVGWSVRSPNNYLTSPPSNLQPAWRISSQVKDDRWRVFFDRVTLEGGDAGLLCVTVGSNTVLSNIVVDKMIIVQDQRGGFAVGSEYDNMTLRNVYILRPAMPPLSPPRDYGSAAMTFGQNASTLSTGTIRLSHITAHIVGTTAQLDAVAYSDGLAIFSAGVASEVANSFLYAPNLDTPVGTAFAPFTEVTLTGFVPQSKGLRWNFPPLGWQSAPPYWNTTCGQARFNETGTNAAVPVNGWVKLPWPDFTGLCNGAGMADVRAAAAANATQKHVCAVGFGDSFAKANNTLIMQDGTLMATNNDKVRFDLTDPTGLRVQNVSGVEWPADQPILVLLDLSDYQMPHIPGSGLPAVTPTIIVPTGASAAIGTGAGVPKNWDDFLLNVWPQSTNKSGVVVSGLANAGAVAVA